MGRGRGGPLLLVVSVQEGGREPGVCGLERWRVLCRSGFRLGRWRFVRAVWIWWVSWLGARSPVLSQKVRPVRSRQGARGRPASAVAAAPVDQRGGGEAELSGQAE